MARNTDTMGPRNNNGQKQTGGATETTVLTHGSTAAANSRVSQAGFTVTEIIVSMFIATLLMTIGVHLFQNQREKTRLVKCMAEVRGIQASVMNMGDGRYIPDPGVFWDNAWPDGRKHGPYYYIVDGDPNKGHGNDLDGVDEENPGASDPDKKDIKFVIFCDHDHGELAKYVYLTDEEPPTVASDVHDPDYQRFIKWEYGGPGGGNGGGMGGKSK